MTLTKEQRLDWLTYMYILFLSEENLSWNTLWFTVETGSLTGFYYQPYVTRALFPELLQFDETTKETVRKAIHLCEQAKK